MTDLERTDDVAAAMVALARRDFLPAEQREHADEDRPLPLGPGQTSSQPSTVATMLRLLHVALGLRVLDVGAGSGWTTALLARLVGPTGSVVGVELEPRLAEWGAANLARCAMGWARLEPARAGVLGHPAEVGYDRILVSAAARTLPHELIAQLDGRSPDGGRMVVPVRRTLWVVERHGDRIRRTSHGSYLFVPLR